MFETSCKENVEVWRPIARAWRIVLTLVCVGTLSGCAQVKPQADFARTRQLIGDRIGAGAVYDPDAEALSAEEIETTLADGISARSQGVRGDPV